MIRVEMHPVGQKLQVPLDELEDKLIQLTDPNFTGNLEAVLCLRQTAIHEVEWQFITEKCVPDPNVKTERSESSQVTNSRVAIVRRWMAEIRSQFLLELPKSKLRISFLRGELKSLKIVEID